MDIPTGSGARAAADDVPALQSPAKPPNRLVAPRSDPISTPEKPAELPRRGGSRLVAFSVKQVRRAVLDLRSPVKAKATAEGDASGVDAGSPEEKNRTGRSGGKRPCSETPVKLPEEYERLGHFFNSMVSSMRLMRLKGQMCTFSKVRPKVEYLTDRRFTHEHLAQMKYILSEALVLKKVLCHDEATSCVKPDIQISVLPHAVGSGMRKEGESDYSSLNKVFRARLAEYFEEHPEDGGIPEASLPEPFGRTRIDQSRMLGEKAVPSSTNSDQIEPSSVRSEPKFVAPSHMSQSFKRRFSRNGAFVLPKQMEFDTAVSKSTVVPVSPVKCSLKSPSRKMSSILSDKQIPCGNSDCSASVSKKIGAPDETPSKSVSTPIRTMAATPELQTPKRYWTNVDDLTPPTKKSVKRPLSLDDQTDLDDVPPAIRFLPKALLLSVKEKERKVNEGREANVMKAKRRQQMISSLPKLFDMIHLIFQASIQSIITKQQLIFKIISGNLDVVDRDEVEEQLALLQELVPDWISGRTTTTGDLVFSVSKVVKPESIRQILKEAK